MKKLVQITKQLLATLLVVGLISSCANTEQLLEEGNYEKLVKLAHKKLKNKKQIKAKYVIALEAAFNEMQARDLGRMEQLRANGDVRDWKKVYRTATDIERRQVKLQPHLPIVDDRGYQAKFNFIKIHGMITDAKEQISNLLYNEAIDNLVEGRAGDKMAARQAYNKLKDLSTYSSNYKNAVNMMSEATELGQTKVWVATQMSSADYLPQHFERELLELNFGKMNSYWTKYYIRPAEQMDFDYKAILKIVDIDVSPEGVYERANTRCKTIQDGWTFLTDREGNYLTDTLGNRLKEPRMVEVRATVLMTELTKGALVQGRMEIVDLRKKAVVESRPISAESSFNHFASRYVGDHRALTTNECRVIPIVPFPSDLDLILDSADELKPQFLRELKRCKLI